MKALADSVAKLARPLIGKRGFTQAEILLQWAHIVGPDLARLSLPVKLSFPRKEGHRSGGILHLKVESAAALEIQHLEPQILDRVNTYCGYPAIARLMLRQGRLSRPPAPPPPPRPLPAAEANRLEQRLAGIDDDMLKHALQRLAVAVFDRTRN